jgi:hypothetical protein
VSLCSILFSYYVEFCNAECPFAEKHYGECRYAVSYFLIMLNFVMVSVLKLKVINAEFHNNTEC